jgi:hypothetical protein
MDLLSPQENEDSGEKMVKYLERAVKNEQVKSAYSSLARFWKRNKTEKRRGFD